jgi:hypothetical protein
MYTRKTKDEYQIKGDYGYGHGFEEVCSEDTKPEAIKRLKEYRQNEPGTPFKIVKKRIKVEDK